MVLGKEKHSESKAPAPDDLSQKRPVELRAIARDLGVENADRLTGAQAKEAIRAHSEAKEEHKQ